MEFPGVGKQCQVSICRQLDFLPVKCDACGNTFCSDHYTYDSHSCQVSTKKDVQVPVCPLCDSPIPGRSDELPDIRVGRHIDSECQSGLSGQKKVYTNRCSQKGCKQKEMIPIVCDQCGLNFCLRHRHSLDHLCLGTKNALSKTGLAAMKRAAPQSSSGKAVQHNRKIPEARRAAESSCLDSYRRDDLPEDVAIALAIQASLGPSTGASKNQHQALSQEQEDLLLAQAIAASEIDAQNSNSRSKGRVQESQKGCQLS